MGELLLINVPWSQELSDVLELTLLSLAFGPSLTVASTLLHPYSIEDKTPKIMLKQLSTGRDTQRFTQLYKEENREDGDRGDQEQKRESQKGREQSSQ